MRSASGREIKAEIVRVERSAFPEHHTAKNIAEKVQQVMAEYGLEKNCLLSMLTFINI